MVNGQWSMVNGQWSMVNGQWSMVNGQWSMINTPVFALKLSPNLPYVLWHNLFAGICLFLLLTSDSKCEHQILAALNPAARGASPLHRAAHLPVAAHVATMMWQLVQRTYTNGFQFRFFLKGAAHAAACHPNTMPVTCVIHYIFFLFTHLFLF
jgi:hypothetical protein